MHQDRDITPQPINTSFAPPPQPSELESSRSQPGKSVQWAEDPPPRETHSDSEIDNSTPTREQRRRSGKRTSSPASDDSSDTIELPARFDANGNPVRHDSVADAVEAFLTGRNGAGRSFNSAMDDFIGVPRRNGRRRSSGRAKRRWDE